VRPRVRIDDVALHDYSHMKLLKTCTSDEFKKQQMKLLPYIVLFFLSCDLLAQNEIVPITKESKPFTEDVYVVVEEMPEFPGGEMELQKFYSENSTHPIVAKGRKAVVVYYEIVIDEEGNATKFRILRGQSENLNQLTEELVSKMPKWRPGKQKGKPVKVVKAMEVRYATLD